MKLLPVIAFGSLLIGCSTTTPRTVPVTAERAAVIARQLANEKAHTLYDCRPFEDDEPARFIDGHWLWRQRQARGVGDLESSVELAADGSPRRVDVILLDSRAIRARLYRRP